MSDIVATASFCTNLQSLRISENWKSGAATFTAQTTDTVAAVPGAACTVSLGENSASLQLTGYIDSLEVDYRTGVTQVVGRDIMRRAVEYFLAPQSDGRAEFYTTAVDFCTNVSNLLALAGLTLAPGASGYIAYPECPLVCMSVWDAVAQFTQLIAWRVWADHHGTLHMASDQLTVPAPSHTIDNSAGGNTTVMQSVLNLSSDETVNKVIVLGAQLTATHKAYGVATDLASPISWSKAAVISQGYIGSDAEAQDIADYNLSLYKPLTQIARVQILGGEDIFVGDGVEMTDGDFDGDWLVYELIKEATKTGMLTSLTMRRPMP